jgi:hypothetical protein
MNEPYLHNHNFAIDGLIKGNLNDMIQGFVKIFRTHKETGVTELLVDKRNLVLNMGAQALSYALSGKPGYNISGFYIGYNNTSSFTPPVIDVNYSVPFSSFTPPFGYLRQALSFAPSYSPSGAGYIDNTSFYTTQISSATAFGGAAFTNGVSNIYEIALVAQPNPTNASTDLVFSRVNFNPVTWNNNYALTFTWGIQFLS